MGKHAMVIGAVVAAMAASGCGASMRSTARAHRSAVEEVATFDGGGVLRLHGSIMQATPEAHLVMMERCGGRWALLRDDEAVAVRTSVLAGKSTGLGAPATIDPDRDLTYRCVSHASRSRAGRTSPP